MNGPKKSAQAFALLGELLALLGKIDALNGKSPEASPDDAGDDNSTLDGLSALAEVARLDGYTAELDLDGSLRIRAAESQEVERWARGPEWTV